MELKSIERTDRQKARLNAALGIYRDTILPEAQSPERQILYWIEHSRDTLTDEFRCFAIQGESGVVGYLQYSYFCEEHVFFFEYLCIRDSTRKGLVPSAALHAIEHHLAENYRPGFTIVFEIAQTRTPAGDWAPDKKLRTYFTRLGFRKLEFDYHYPILQSYDGAISYPADLMIRLPDSRIAVSAPELRTILRCLYFKHYLRWDRPFLSTERFGEREKLINALYSRQVTQIPEHASLVTLGDDRRSVITRFGRHKPQIVALLDRVFGPKLPRIASAAGILLLVQWLLGSSWMLLPFVLAVSAIYCLAEDTDASRKLLTAIFSKFRLVPPKSS